MLGLGKKQNVKEQEQEQRPEDLFGGIGYDANAEYHAILDRADKPHPTDPERIRELVATLGITLDRAKRDLQNVRRVKELDPLAATVDAKSKLALEAGSVLNVKQKEFNAIEAKYRAELHQLRADFNAKEVKWKAAMDARTEVNTLRKGNPRAFGGPCAKPEPQLEDTFRPQVVNALSGMPR